MAKHHTHNSQPNSQPSLSEEIDHWLATSLQWLVQLAVFAVPLYFAFNTEELFEFNKLLLVYVLTGAMLSCWLGRMIIQRRVVYQRSVLDIWLLIFLASQVISTVFSIHIPTSLWGYYTRFHGGLLSTIVYCLWYWMLVSNFSYKQIRPLLVTAITSATLVSIYGILEHFGHSASCLLANPSVPSFGVDCWVQDVQHRVFATFGQPNWLAAYAVMIIALFPPLLINERLSLRIRSLLLVALSLISWVLLYTNSRSGVLAAMVAMGVSWAGALLAMYAGGRPNSTDRSTKQSNRKRQLRWLGAGLAIVVIASLSSGTPYSPSVSDWWRQRSSAAIVTTNPIEVPAAISSAAVAPVNRLDIGGTDSGEIRKIVWRGALDVWKRYPWFGSGVDTFGYSYYQDRPVAHNLVSEWDFLYNKAHNEFLNFLATSGAVGLGAYLLLWGVYALWSIWRTKVLLSQGDGQLASLMMTFLAAHLGLAISNFFGFSTVMVTFLQYLLAAGSVVVSQSATIDTSSANQADPAASTTFPPPTKRTWVLLGLASLCFIITTWFVWVTYTGDVAYTEGKALLSAGYLKPAIVSLETATSINPYEALYWDQLSLAYAQASQVTTPEASKLLREGALQTSDLALQLNDRQLNFYKSRARMLSILGQQDPQYLRQAITTLQKAQTSSPTDARLAYNIGVIHLALGEVAPAMVALRQAVHLKPNYESALLELAKNSAAQHDFPQAQLYLTQILQYNPLNTVISELQASYSAQAQKTKK